MESDRSNLAHCEFGSRAEKVLRRGSRSDAIAVGSEDPTEAGNINATFIGDTHYLALYSGHSPNTSVHVTEAAAPSKR